MKKLAVLKINLIWIFIVTAPLFLFGLIYYRSNSHLVFEIISLASLLYLIMAMVHHVREKTLSVEIVVEYVLIAVLALVVLQELFT